MAENLKPAAAKDKPKGKPGKGHNITELRKSLAPYVTDIMKMYDEMEEDHGSHVTRIGNKFEKVGEATGFGTGKLRSEIARMRRRQKEIAKEQEMDEDEREETERFREALAGTPMAKWAEGELAKPKAG